LAAYWAGLVFAVTLALQVSQLVLALLGIAGMDWQPDVELAGL
tara:strand:+ start:220 stop:348 length:129 start_codon:yes stop_codon:yes gene_type:complete